MAENRKEKGTLRLACFQCRAKRIRCGGVKPVCPVGSLPSALWSFRRVSPDADTKACEKHQTQCEWPASRKRKRTRAEMEAEREAVRQSAEQYPQHSAERHLLPGNVVPKGRSLHSPLGASVFEHSPQAHFTENLLSENLRYSGSNQPDPSKAFWRNEEAEPPSLNLFYYRLVSCSMLYGSADPQSGLTSMHPRTNRVDLRLQRNPESMCAAPLTSREDETRPPTPVAMPLFDSTGMPLPHVHGPLFDLYFRHVSHHFPSFSRRRMSERFATNTMSHLIANSICAIGARFSDQAQGDPAKASAPFITKAQEFVVSSLHIPTHDTCSALLLLAWACYGQGSESGLWQFGGLAIRMCIDLGAHEVIETYESPAHQLRIKRLLWSIYITDRVISFATGRKVTLTDDMIEVPLPEDADFFPDSSRDTECDPIEMVEPVPFVQLVKLMVICGRLANVLNGRRGRKMTFGEEPDTSREELPKLQISLIQFISTLPPSLQWTLDNFKHQQARGHGVSGVLLSSLTYRQSLWPCISGRMPFSLSSITLSS